jgi:hypothetical protein
MADIYSLMRNPCGCQEWTIDVRLTALAVLLTLAACADTGPLSIGKDAYSISVRVPFSGPAGAKGQALQEASTFCASQGKQVLLEQENASECALHGGCGEAEIHFLCLKPDDPRYTAPHADQR